MDLGSVLGLLLDTGGEREGLVRDAGPLELRFGLFAELRLVPGLRLLVSFAKLRFLVSFGARLIFLGKLS